MSTLIAGLTIFSSCLTNLMKEPLLELHSSQAELARKYLLQMENTSLF